MSHGVPYFVWRDGRPRWAPGATVRARGATGRDLKDGLGAWLPLDDALQMARELCVKFEVMPSISVARTRRLRPRAAATRRGSQEGYVYYLWVGERVKIGFSTNPFGRAKSLKTGVAEPIEMLVATRGTVQDEQEAHFALRQYRLEGEWFRAADEVINAMLRHCSGERMAWGKQAGVGKASHRATVRRLHATK